ncbi:MAG TPA: site-2 protease family protein [Candidatus Saccharimonadales bacterium]|nr:site-2 protease family protein [Candidatus Saccharimonadales bacterium]
MLTDISGGYLIVTLVTIIVSLSIHEAMHGFAAHWLGDDTAQLEGRLTLNPLKHIDTLTTVLLPMVLIALHLPPLLAAKPVPFDPRRLKYDEFGMAIVGLAGPLTNLALAVIGAIIYRVFGLPGAFDQCLVIFVEINIWFFVFNMIPIPPLDGSRLLYALAPEPLQDVMRQIEAFGFLAILFFFFFVFQFVAGPLSNLVVSIFNFLML